MSAFDEWKFLRAENPVLVKRVELLQDRLAIKDSIILNLNNIADMNGMIIKDYITSEQNLLMQRTNLERRIEELTKSIKKQKRKTILTSVAGVMGIAATAILLLK